MKTIHVSDTVLIPADVKVEFKSRIVTVTGPRGNLTKSFKHADLELDVITNTTGKLKGQKSIKITMWHAGRKHSACLRTCLSHLSNMIKGVTQVRTKQHVLTS